jgi:hypothetical protein
MLVARRDPFHPGAHDFSPSQGGGAAGPQAGGAAPRLTRAMSVLQIAGTLLALPVGIGSAYSIYRANFSVETTCQSLRANIVAMLDKSVDAAARRMLIRRDVAAFEQSCGAIDPDATAAFKTLLSADKAPAPAVEAPRSAEAQTNASVRKVEPRANVAVKQPAANAASAAAATEPVRSDPAASDDKWLAEVRRALVRQNPQPVPSVEAEKPAAILALPVSSLPRAAIQAPPVSPLPRAAIQAPPAAPLPRAAMQAPPMPPPPRESWTVNERQAPPAAAPTLPPAIAVITATPSGDADHPVPPAPIPDLPPSSNQANAARPEPHQRSRLGAWVAQIPLLGKVVDAVDGGPN